MTYWRLYYHVVWATRDRSPWISGDAAPLLHGTRAAKASQMGALVHAVGGTEDHVHLVASLPPTIAVTEFVRQVKGSSSHFANHELSLPSHFAWQTDFGVISFDSRVLDRIVGYVNDQRRHHQSSTTIAIFERTSGDAAPESNRP